MTKEEKREYERQRRIDKKDQIAAYKKDYAQKNPEKIRAQARKTARKRSGNLATSETRSGVCPICLRHVQVLHLDHDHATSKVRGWICGSCNRALGMFHDDAEALIRAAQYLRS